MSSEATAPLEDLVFSAASGGGAGGELSVRVPLLWIDAPRSQASKLLALSFLPRGLLAHQNAVAVIAESLEMRDLAAGMKMLSDNLEKAARSSVDGPIGDLLEEHAADIEDERANWKSILALLSQERNERDSDRLTQALESTARGFQTLGDQRTAYWAAALGALEPLVSTYAQAPLCAIAGYLRERLDPSEAEATYLSGILEGVRRRDDAFILCSRLMADLQSRLGRPHAALGTIEKALKAQPEGDMVVDAARFAGMAGEHKKARELWTRALHVRPLSLIELLADEDPLFEIALKAQSEAREQARNSQARWTELAAKITDIETRMKGDLDIPKSLRPSRELPVAGTDFYSSWTLLLEAESGSKKLIEHAKRAIAETIALKRAELDSARHTLEAVISQRDETLGAIKRQRDQIETSAREDMERIVKESGLQRGCTISAGMGCGMMILYVIASFVITGVGPETSLGKIIIGIIALPLLIGATLQVMAGMKRAALEAEMMRKIFDAQASFNRTRSTALDKFKQRVDELTGALQAAESSLARAEEAQKSLA